MLQSLIGAFINVIVLTRGLQYLLKKRMKDARKRAYIVFISVTVFDSLVLMISQKSLSALQVMLLYYGPFLVMWLMVDLLNASKENRKQDQ